MSDDSQIWYNAVGVLKPGTLKMLQAHLGPAGRNLVDGWAATNPKQVQAWEASGQLLSKALEAVDSGAEAEERAVAQGFGHLSRAEMFEMFGGPSFRLPRDE